MLYPKISYSGLEKFEKCQQMWWLNKSRKRTPIDPKYVTDGNAIHAALEAVVTGIPEDPVAAALSFWLMRVREENVRWTDDEKREHFERVGHGATKLVSLVDEISSRSSSHARMLSEVRMVFTKPTYALEGFFDLVVEPQGEGKGVEIWDVKTGRWHLDQLVFYDLLWTSAVGYRPDRLGIIEPFGRGVVEVVVDDSHREDMRGRLAAMIGAVTRGEFPATGYPSKCGWCNSKPWCPKWDKARSGSLGA